MKTKKSNKALDYVVKPLPKDLLRKLPEMAIGERIAVIRKARGLTKSQLRKNAHIASSTYVYVEKRGSIPTPRNLFKISKALEVDPVLIVKGKNWEEISSHLKDSEKIMLLRLRRGWTQTELATALEKAGLRFETEFSAAKRTTVAQWERGIAKPSFNKQDVIRVVLGDGNLFEESIGPMSVTITESPRTTEESTITEVQRPVAEIERKVDRALKYLEKLDALEINGRVETELNKTVRVIRSIIKHLEIIGGKEKAQILEEELNTKLMRIKNKIAEKEKQKRKEEESKISPAGRKIANQTISGLLKEFPGKSIIQILPILVRKTDWSAVQVAVERIEKSQSKKISIEDIVYLNEVKSQLRQAEEEVLP